MVLHRDEVFEVLKSHLGELRGLGVTRLELFGSVARNEATPSSDVDIMVELDSEMRLGLFDIAGIQVRLCEILGVEKVDLVLRDCVRNELKDIIYKEAILVA